MAGVGNKFAPLPPILLNKKKGEPYKPRTPEDVADGKNPFARQLAHGEKDVRDATFRALGKWLGSRSDVDMLDMKKIWKGLFYAMWHADGWDVQEELAETIGGLIHKLKHRVALMYAGVFFITARREWVGIDRHRMDKYLRLVRRFTSHIFRYCADRDWAEAITGDVGEMLMRSALIPTGKGDQGVVDVGLRLHLAEVFVTEMRNVASGKDDVEIGCDPDKENEANGGAPRTVFTRKKGEKRKARGTPTPRPVPPARHRRAAQTLGAAPPAGAAQGLAQARVGAGFREGSGRRGWRPGFCGSRIRGRRRGRKARSVGRRDDEADGADVHRRRRGRGYR